MVNPKTANSTLRFLYWTKVLVSLSGTMRKFLSLDCITTIVKSQAIMLLGPCLIPWNLKSIILIDLYCSNAWFCWQHVTLHVGTQNSQNRNYAILYFALMLDSSKSKMNDFVDNSSLKQNSQDRNYVILDCLIPWNLKSLAFYSKCIEVLLIEIT